MAFLALGINHKTAPVSVREKVAFAPDKVIAALQEACQVSHVSEVAILSTCNRTELYCVAELPGSRALLEWMGRYHGLDTQQLIPCSYVHWDEDAARHMMKVASGLDSLVLGEPQIFGQLKSAYATAQEAQTVGTELGRLFEQAFSVAKRVRTDTAIGENPVSVAYAAVSLAGRLFSSLKENRALLIGAGKTVELVARHLREAGVQDITVANRTLVRAQELASEFNGRAILLSDIPDYLHQADIVIASTASPLPILGKGAVESALKKRRHKPIFMVDIAVPRDIESQVSELDDVFLYTVDDLRQVIDENIRSREGAAREAEHLVESGAGEFMLQMRALGATGVLKAFREHSEMLRDQELEKALRTLKNGVNPEQVLRSLARGLTNKLIHSPTVQVRKATAGGRDEATQWLRELFDLKVDKGTPLVMPSDEMTEGDDSGTVTDITKAMNS
ncbi:MAG: glutamyl-tRNA reductase [Hahellaceae bacterium]|nr:glutamyl-tRNA reductase [Hahellaceae bacterium]MCP5168884.1 glutamyl-tRNA reductase [Hahellaceae bacterium]